jgi:hypothetical protein
MAKIDDSLQLGMWNIAWIMNTGILHEIVLHVNSYKHGDDSGLFEVISGKWDVVGIWTSGNYVQK